MLAQDAPIVAEAQANRADLERAFSRMTEAVRIGINVGSMKNRDMDAFRAAQAQFESAADEFGRALGVNLSLMERLAVDNHSLRERLEHYEPEESGRGLLFSNLRHAWAVLRGE